MKLNPHYGALRRLRLGRAGASLAEVVIAMGIGSVAFGGAMRLNSNQLMLLKATRQANAASLSVEERVEQLRIANWRQITNPDYIKNTFFATTPKSVLPLDGYTERITITGFRTGSSATPPPQMVVEKPQGRSPQVVSQGTGLISERLAKIDFEVVWKGNNGRTRTRSLTTVISEGGLSRQNLPAFGSGTSGTSSGNNGRGTVGGTTGQG